MADDAVIILDPVNMNVIKDSLAKGGKNWIGGNCTVSLMLMGLGFSVVIGLAGSLLPALRAARLPVIVSLKSL